MQVDFFMLFLFSIVMNEDLSKMRIEPKWSQFIDSMAKPSVLVSTAVVKRMVEHFCTHLSTRTSLMNTLNELPLEDARKAATAPGVEDNHFWSADQVLNVVRLHSEAVGSK